MKWSEYVSINYGFSALLVVTIYYVILLCSEWQIYNLKENGVCVKGKITSVDILKEYKTYKLSIQYVYQIEGKRYLGNRYYNSRISYNALHAKEWKEKIELQPNCEIYCNPENYGEGICFLTEKEIQSHRVFGYILVAGWLFWGGLYYCLRKI